MSEKEKLLQRFLLIPSDFSWDELVALLYYFGFNELTKGKTAGSRRKFLQENGYIILLHKPHPGNIVKKYGLRQVKDYLISKKMLQDE